MSNPWNIKKENFPQNGTLEEKIKFVLGYAILAPSTHNSQPWLFKIENDLCRIYYNNNLRLPEADPIGRDLYISMGCMIENLVIAANYFGIFGELNYKVDGNHIADVVFRDQGSMNTDLAYLVDAIAKRVNARGVFIDKSLSSEIRAELSALNKNQHLDIKFITDKKKIENAAILTAQGQKFAHGKDSFRKEMYRWMHNSLTTKKDGMPGYSLKVPFLLSFFIPPMIRLFDMSPLLAKLNYKSMVSAPMVAVITADGNSELLWIETGRLGERLMLQLQSRGIATSIFVASIEMSDLYKNLQQLLDTTSTPQFLFCAGYMPGAQRHSPRHNIENMLL